MEVVMKKIIFMFALLLIVCGCSSSQALKSIGYKELKEKIENKESFVLYIHKTGCSHCESYEPVLKKVVTDNKLTIYSINTASLESAEENSLKEKVNLKGTPTLIYIEKGRSDINGSLIGEQSSEDTIEFFKSIGYIEG